MKRNVSGVRLMHNHLSKKMHTSKYVISNPVFFMVWIYSERGFLQEDHPLSYDRTLNVIFHGSYGRKKSHGAAVSRWCYIPYPLHRCTKPQVSECILVIE